MPVAPGKGSAVSATKFCSRLARLTKYTPRAVLLLSCTVMSALPCKAAEKTMSSSRIPRIGFAYRPIGDKFVVRGGYGIFYLPLGLEPGLTTTPFNYTLTADNLNSDYSPKVNLSDPFPGGLPKPGAANPVSDGSYRLGSNVNIVLRDQQPGYMQEWNLAFSRQLARTTLLTLTYTGSRGVHLPIPSEEFNQINPSALANAR